MTIVGETTADRLHALVASSSQLGTSGIIRWLPPVLDDTSDADPVTALLLAHHSTDTVDATLLLRPSPTPS
jgi:hypothetical protein